VENTHYFRKLPLTNLFPSNHHGLYMYGMNIKLCIFLTFCEHHCIDFYQTSITFVTDSFIYGKWDHQVWCVRHQKYFVPFQLNLPDVNSSALEGVKHSAVLQVLHDTKRFNFSV